MPEESTNRPFMPLCHLLEVLFFLYLLGTCPGNTSTSIILCATVQAFSTLDAAALFGQTFDSIASHFRLHALLRLDAGPTSMKLDWTTT